MPDPTSTPAAPAAAAAAAPGAPGAQPQLTLDTASQAESLDALGGVAQAFDGGAPGAQPGAAPGGQVQVPEPNAVLIADTLKTARDTFCGLAKVNAPRAILTDQECTKMGALWGAWCDRRQIVLGKVLGKHHDTYLAAAATIGLAVTLYQATLAELALRRPVDVKAKPGQGDQVQPGQGDQVRPAAAAAANESGPATFVGGPAT